MFPFVDRAQSTSAAGQFQFAALVAARSVCLVESADPVLVICQILLGRIQGKDNEADPIEEQQTDTDAIDQIHWL